MNSPLESRAATILARLWDATKALVTISDQLKVLEKEDTRLQSQVQDITRIVFEIAKELREFSGQMKGIEKRFDDKDKLIETIIATRVAEEVKKALSEVSGVKRGGEARVKNASKRKGGVIGKPAGT